MNREQKSWFLLPKFFIFPQLRLQNKLDYLQFYTFLNIFTCIPLGNTKNRGIGLLIENFNSEILNFEAFSLKFTFKVTKISDKIDAASSKSAVHNAAKHVLQNSRA